MKPIRLFLLGCSLVMFSLQVTFADSFVIDRTHSSVGFSIRHIVSTVHGRFSRFTGTIEFDSSDINKFSIEMTVQDSSISTDNERRDRDLRSKNFFFVDSFPALTFKSTKAYKKGVQYYVEGAITMRGVTKTITVPFDIGGVVGAGENAVLGLHSTFKLDRTEYGISWNNELDTGGMLLGNEVTVNIDIEAHKPQPPKR